jgi:transposase
VLHIMALTELRQGGEGRRYFDRKTAAAKTKMEAMRCLKRRLSDIVYARMKTDAKRLAEVGGAGPGGQPGATLQSSAADSHPDIGTSDQGQITRRPSLLTGHCHHALSSSLATTIG